MKEPTREELRRYGYHVHYMRYELERSVDPRCIIKGNSVTGQNHLLFFCRDQAHAIQRIQQVGDQMWKLINECCFLDTVQYLEYRWREGDGVRSIHLPRHTEEKEREHAFDWKRWVDFDLDNYSITKLRRLGRERGIKGYSTMDRWDLVKKLRGY